MDWLTPTRRVVCWSPLMLASALASGTLILIRLLDVPLQSPVVLVSLAMLVIGGLTSLWGAVVGALLASGVNSLLLSAEDGIGLGLVDLDVPTGTSLVTLGAVMALIMLFRPTGITGGREIRLPGLR